MEETICSQQVSFLLLLLLLLLLSFFLSFFFFLLLSMSVQNRRLEGTPNTDANAAILTL